MRTFVIAALAVCALATAAIASGGYFQAFRSVYKPKSDSAVGKALCQTCHSVKFPSASSHGLNPYGDDLLKAMKEDQPGVKTPVLKPELLKKVEKLDSDKDGVSNGDELKADKFPGDKTSKP